MKRNGGNVTIELLHVAHHDSALQEQRAAGGKPAHDFFERYPAERIDPAKHTPMKAGSSHTLDGRPLLWLSADKSAVVLDERAFPAGLRVVDATRSFDETVLGTVTPAARAAPGDAAIVRFLIQSGVIRVYVHIEASLRGESAPAKDGAFEATYVGQHVFYTNAENRAPLGFSVRIAKDGTISAVSSPRGKP